MSRNIGVKHGLSKNREVLGWDVHRNAGPCVIKDDCRQGAGVYGEPVGNIRKHNSFLSSDMVLNSDGQLKVTNLGHVRLSSVSCLFDRQNSD